MLSLGKNGYISLLEVWEPTRAEVQWLSFWVWVWINHFAFCPEILGSPVNPEFPEHDQLRLIRKQRAKQEEMPVPCQETPAVWPGHIALEAREAFELGPLVFLRDSWEWHHLAQNKFAECQTHPYLNTQCKKCSKKPSINELPASGSRLFLSLADGYQQLTVSCLQRPRFPQTLSVVAKQGCVALWATNCKDCKGCLLKRSQRFLRLKTCYFTAFLVAS